LKKPLVKNAESAAVARSEKMQNGMGTAFSQGSGDFFRQEGERVLPTEALPEFAALAEGLEGALG
jgi:hypothetical protein